MKKSRPTESAASEARAGAPAAPVDRWERSGPRWGPSGRTPSPPLVFPSSEDDEEQQGGRQHGKSGAEGNGEGESQPVTERDELVDDSDGEASERGQHSQGRSMEDDIRDLRRRLNHLQALQAQVAGRIPTGVRQGLADLEECGRAVTKALTAVKEASALLHLIIRLIIHLGVKTSVVTLQEMLEAQRI